MATLEDNQFINDYDTKRQKLMQEGTYDLNAQKALESLKPLIQDNLEYLKYAKAKGWFTVEGEKAQEASLHNALITILGRSIKWDIRQARMLALEILEEVNDHPTREKVKKLKEFRGL